jgi:lipopolysaccharide/colanic/teichoic acid biosynthesis glycosyltransferase
MTHAPEQKGPSVTRAGDPRVTTIGRVLRKWKVDELPQLMNVICGEMSFVGPRPDVPEFIAELSLKQRRILYVSPGITGSATLQYRNEEELLSTVPREELKRFYCNDVLPDKIRIDLEYAQKSRFLSDVAILIRTVGVILA